MKKLQGIFRWEEDSSSDLRFYMASAVQSQGKNQHALDFCEKWYEEEKDNVVAATALIYARMHIKDFDFLMMSFRLIKMDEVRGNEKMSTIIEMMLEIKGNRSIFYHRDTG